MIDTIQQALITEWVADALQRLRNIQQKTFETKRLEDILQRIWELNKTPVQKVKIERLDFKLFIEGIDQVCTTYLNRQGICFKNYVSDSLWVKTNRIILFHILFRLIFYMGKHACTLEDERFISIEARVYNEKLVAIYLEDNGIHPRNARYTLPHQTIYSSQVLEGIGLTTIQRWSKVIRGSFQLIDKPSQGIKCCLILLGDVLH